MDDDNLCSDNLTNINNNNDNKNIDSFDEKKSDESPTEWDGSEASFVENDDADEYGEEYSGIRISYKLTEEEIYKSLKRVGFCSASKGKNIIKSAFLLSFFIIFLVLFCFSGNLLNLFTAIATLLVLFAVWFVPFFRIKNKSRIEGLRASEITVEIYPDEMEITSNGSSWEIQLDSSATLAEYEDMFILHLKNGNIFVIPVRAIEPNVLGEIGSMLKAGTNPEQNLQS